MEERLTDTNINYDREVLSPGTMLFERYESIQWIALQMQVLQTCGRSRLNEILSTLIRENLMLLMTCLSLRQERVDKCVELVYSSIIFNNYYSA